MIERSGKRGGRGCTKRRNARRMQHYTEHLADYAVQSGHWIVTCACGWQADEESKTLAGDLHRAHRTEAWHARPQLNGDAHA